ncbi:cytochrome b5-like [Aricia agestis]|uniref:cytochrome b5-like n=1 Tax=Aricia agestis TaxID=91739 RepID=UPI001C203CD8|nr:cytochrome b5-like [Aricia agestis]
MAEKTFKRAELASRNSKADAVFVIDNRVYDVTQFLDDHPGGHEVLLNVAGGDATEDFEDVGHSLDAKELMKKYLVGEVAAEDRVERKTKSSAWSEPAAGGAGGQAEGGGLLSSWKLPLVLGLLLTVLYSYLFG